MSGAMLEGTKEGVYLIGNTAVVAIQDRDADPAMPTPPIEFVTENGFCIVRLCSLQPATVDSVGECHFVVRNPNGEEAQLVVAFDETVISQVQSQRHTPLSSVSLFWLTLAEQHLATYIWINDHSPVGGLMISYVSGPNLALAAGWID